MSEKDYTKFDWITFRKMVSNFEESELEGCLMGYKQLRERARLEHERLSKLAHEALTEYITRQKQYEILEEEKYNRNK